VQVVALTNVGVPKINRKTAQNFMPIQILIGGPAQSLKLKVQVFRESFDIIDHTSN
jgi:hypothetical protein